MCQSCSSPAYAFLHDLPKVEHHIHIEGAFEPSLLFPMAKRNGIELPAPMYTTIEALDERYKNFTDLDDFLAYFNCAMAALIHEIDFSELAYEYMKRVARDGLRHAEIFFDPQAHMVRGIALSTVIAGLEAGLQRGSNQFEISFVLIPCFVRHLPVEHAVEMVGEIAPFVKSGQVTGLGCDSTELGNPPLKWAPVYAKAREVGFPRLTMHAGEEDGADAVRAAIELLGMERIDHAVRSADDPTLLALMAERKIMATICPLSNVRLRVHKSVSESPIPLFLAAGAPFSINSDDPSYFGGYILDNYNAVHDNFAFSKEVWKGIVLDTITYSWCGDERKAELVELLEGVMTKWEGKDI